MTTDDLLSLGLPLDESLKLMIDKLALTELGKRAMQYIPAGTRIPLTEKVTQEDVDTVRRIQLAMVDKAQGKQPISYQPSPPPEAMARRQKPRQIETPNKMATADPKWENKVAWDSDALRKRQKDLETHSVEIEMLFEVIRGIAIKALGKVISHDELDFYANFGSPIEANTQKISITLKSPISLQIMLIRQLVAGKLKWSADVGITADTPITSQTRIIDLAKAGGELKLPGIEQSIDNKQESELRELPSVEKERKLRKVKL